MLKEFFSKIWSAATQPAEAPPRVPSKQVVIPTFLGSGKNNTLPNSATDYSNLDLAANTRTAGTMAKVIRQLCLVSPDLSSAIATKISTAITNSYTAIAYDPQGRIDPQGTEMIQAFTRRLDFVSYDYTRFTRSTDFRSVSTSLLYDSLRYGSMGMELVLGKMKVPSFFRPFSTANIKWADNAPDDYPLFVGRSGDIPLNFSTIFYSSTAQDLETPYSDPPLQAAVQICLWDMEFLQDLRRAATKNLLMRLKIVINSEKFIETLPTSIRTDSDKLEEYMTALTTKIEAQLNNLDPEDSLVLFDIMDASTISDANRSEDKSIKVLQDLIDGKLATGAKVLPSVIGRGGTSSTASAEAMLFMVGLSAVQHELNVLFSRGLSLVLRLFNRPGYVKFKFKDVNLRPELELASFRAIEQSSILEQLSFGFIDDIEASIQLTGTLPPAGFIPLAGTRFTVSKPSVTSNDYSNTSVSADGKTNSNQTQKNNAADNKGVKSQ